MEKFWQEVGFLAIIAMAALLVYSFVNGNLPTFLTNTWTSLIH